MSFIYQTFIYKPLLNTLIFLYNTLPWGDLGIAIILLTILIRIVLFPLFHKSAEYQKRMQIIQPKIKSIQEKHKEDKVKQTEEIMAVYKAENLNPFSGFLFLIIQIPILIALYHIFLKIFNPETLNGLYGFVVRPESLNPSFLNLINLGESSILMVVLAAAAQYFQAKLALPKNSGNSMPERMAKQMVFLGPIITVIIFYNMPAAVSLYWAVASVFSVVQQVIINKKIENAKLERIN